MHRFGLRAALCIGSLSLVVCGCSSGKNISGTVSMDGQPLADARVEFHPKENLNMSVAEAQTDAQGHYEIRPRPKGKEGLPPGQYVVFVKKMVDKKSGAVPSPQDYGQLEAAGLLKNKVPEQYSNRFFPKITMDVGSDTKELPPIEIKSR
jgi:hypothetical protein